MRVRLFYGTGNQRLREFHHHAATTACRGATHEQIHLSILYTTRRIYHECAHVFWTTNTFILQPLDLYCAFSRPEDEAKSFSTSFFRKMQHVYLKVNIHSLTSPNDEVERAIAVLQRMGSQHGSLTSLTLNPIQDLLDLELATDRLKGYHRPHDLVEFYAKATALCTMFRPLDALPIERLVDVKAGWNGSRMDDRSQKTFLAHYQPHASILLETLAMDMAGPNGGLWVDGALCYAKTEDETFWVKNPFPVTEIEVEESEKSVS
jgi:hypothetical protein